MKISFVFKKMIFSSHYDFRPFSSEEKGAGDEFGGRQRVFQ
jgi:hypothetical protein